MQPSRNTVKTIVKSTFLRFQHYSTFEFLIRKTWLKLSEIDEKTGCKNASQKRSKNVEKLVKNRRKSIKNGLEIDAKMMIGSKMTFWRHLGRLGGILVL